MRCTQSDHKPCLWCTAEEYILGAAIWKMLVDWDNVCSIPGQVQTRTRPMVIQQRLDGDSIYLQYVHVVKNSDSKSKLSIRIRTRIISTSCICLSTHRNECISRDVLPRSDNMDCHLINQTLIRNAFAFTRYFPMEDVILAIRWVHQWSASTFRQVRCTTSVREPQLINSCIQSHQSSPITLKRYSLSHTKSLICLRRLILNPLLPCRGENISVLNVAFINGSSNLLLSTGIWLGNITMRHIVTTIHVLKRPR